MLFAYALHRLTEWTPVAIYDPTCGFAHAVVQHPDGRWIDAGGWTDLATVTERYGLEAPEPQETTVEALELLGGLSRTKVAIAEEYARRCLGHVLAEVGGDRGRQ